MSKIRMYLVRAEKTVNNLAYIAVLETLEENKDVDVVYLSTYSSRIFEALKNPDILKDKEKPVINEWESIYGTSHLETDEDIQKFINFRRCCSVTLQELPGTPEDYALPKLSYYKGREIKEVEIVDPWIPEDIKKKINDSLVCIAACGLAPEKYDTNDKSHYSSGPVGYYVARYCSKCKKITYVPQDHLYYGCDCINHAKRIQVVEREVKRQVKKSVGYYSIGKLTPKKQAQYRFVQITDEKITISMVDIEVSLIDSVLKKKIMMPYELTYTVQDGMKVVAHTKAGDIPIDAVSAGISNTAIPTVIIPNDEMELFMHEKVLRACGFLDVMKYKSTACYSIPDLFCKYLTALEGYPPLEQLVKAGYYKIFDIMHNSLLTKDSKGFLSKKEQYDRLIDNNGTTSKNAVRLPKYIMDYLISTNSDIESFIDWVDIYELTNLSKEQFDKLINSVDFIAVQAHSGIKRFCNILKYGYDTEKLLHYIIKAKKKCPVTLSVIVTYLNDYLYMCETLGIEPDKYPMDLKKQHDDIVTLYNSKQWEEENKTLSEIGEKLESYLGSSIKGDEKRPETLDDYTIVVPKKHEDFIEEGNRQHNCVASYASRVAGRECYIYFLRRKDATDESFITAEYTKNGYGQFLLSNNRVVKNEELKAISKYIAEKISKGIKAGKLAEVE